MSVLPNPTTNDPGSKQEREISRGLGYLGARKVNDPPGETNKPPLKLVKPTKLPFVRQAVFGAATAPPLPNKKKATAAKS